MLRIVGLFTAAAVAYGVLHNQITARICVEYFTVAHAPIVRSDSPTLLGLVWGVVAGAPAGAFAGALVALAARDGPGPKLEWRLFVRPVLWIAAGMAASALLAGVAGFVLTARGCVHMIDDYARLLPPHRYPHFMADVYAHLASFLVGLIGSLLIAARSRGLRSRLPR